MRIRPNIIFPWDGAHASIPANWVRETSLDGKYPKSYGSAAVNVTGGNSTHSHTSPAHSHTLQNHTHTYILTSAGVTTQGASFNAAETPLDTHTHNGTSGASNGGTTSADAVTYGAVSNDPPYYEVIFIKSQGGEAPDDIIGYWNGGTPPDNWKECDGQTYFTGDPEEYTVPDLRNKYLKGAATAQDSGATGGSTTNTHDISHSHTAQSHTHDAANSGLMNEAGVGDGNANAPTNLHVHQVSLNAATQAINSYSGSLVTAETVEPAHKKLLALIKKGEGANAIGLIGLYLGDITELPSGYHVCDGTNGTPDLRDKFIKVANDAGEIGDTGGSNTHTHAAQSHSHTSSGSHTHTGNASSHVDAGVHRSQASSSVHRTVAGSTHPVSSVSSASPSYDSATTTADSADNQPEYRTVYYVMLKSVINGGYMLDNFT